MVILTFLTEPLPPLLFVLVSLMDFQQIIIIFQVTAVPLHFLQSFCAIRAAPAALCLVLLLEGKELPLLCHLPS